MRAILVLALLAALSPSLGLAQRINWEQPITVIAPEDVSLSLALAGETHFGFLRAWVSAGRTTPDNAEVSSTQAAIERDRMFGFLIVRDGLGRTAFEETTAQAKLKSLTYWRDRSITPRRAGLFVKSAVNIRWILFPHTSANNAAHECAAFVGNGAKAGIEIAGYWCVAGGKPLSEGDVQALVGAVGYKNILSPTPLAAMPGR